MYKPHSNYLWIKCYQDTNVSAVFFVQEDLKFSLTCVDTLINLVAFCNSTSSTHFPSSFCQLKSKLNKIFCLEQTF